MAKTKLTEKTVSRLRAPTASKKQELVWDSELKGFAVLCSGVTATKSYVAQRDMPDGRSRRVTIGSVNEMSLEQARDEAAEMIHGLRRGLDPKARSGTGTLRETLDDYLATHTDLRAKSVDGYRESIGYLNGWLDRPLASITREGVEDKHRAIAAAIAKGGRYSGKATANSTMRALRALWNHAIDRDPSLGPNPVRLKRQWHDVPRRDRLISGDELPAWYQAVKALDNTVQRDFLLMLLFTGLRRSEAASLRWSDVDLKGKVLRVPAARTKAGRKLDLPLTTFVHDMLVARRSLGDTEFVFPSNAKSGHLMEPKFALGLVAEASGVQAASHDLRRTFITVAESTDISPLALKALINHSLGGGVTEGYIVMTVDRLREPAERVAERMAGLCQVPRPGGGNVRRISN